MMITMPDDFAVFILTHGRPDRVFTYKALLKSNYTGKVYFIVDNEDKTVDKYKERFGDAVIVFDKKAIAETIDEADNFGDRRTIIYARNYCFEVAKELGIKYFIQLDDDYDRFHYKFNINNVYKERMILNLDAVLTEMLKFYNSIDCLSVAMAQNGDFIGGAESGMARFIKPKRKAMNTFICSTERPFKFFGRINEDVNTYVNLGSKGKLFLTINYVAINQKDTQHNKGGMTDVYLDSGTYLKSFYTVMYNPSSVTIAPMGTRHKRLHHRINWNNSVPCIINERHKK